MQKTQEPRERPPAPTTTQPHPPDPPRPITEDELDEELDETFPASDPLPWHHDST